MIKLLSLAVFAVAVATISSQSAIRGLPGSDCAGNEHCTAENSECYRQNPCWLGTCYCKKGFTLSRNYTEDIGDCVEDKKLGGTCGWMQGGCMGNLECDRGTTPTTYTLGTCKCPYGTTDGEEWCTGSVALHGVCGTQTPTSDHSDWACKAFNDYYKDDLDADSDFQTEQCQYNSQNRDYRCTCDSYYEEDAGNTTCQRKEFAAYGGDCTTKGCDPEILDMRCDTSDKCVCGPNLSPRNYNGEDGVIKQVCAHASAVFEVEAGHECEISGDPAKYMYCEWPLECGTCPEDGSYNVKLCMNSYAGAAEMAVSFAVLWIALFSTKFM